ncbi:MAG TPA: pyridoxamine 5'-phosphate oxidase [Bacteroidales bacterium]|nr:pyridoxamine 5'-phosphate oxidase [Bacteroidales bacterium]
MAKKNFTRLRQQISGASFGKAQLHPDPFVQFEIWFDQAVNCGILEPNAMTLATSAPDGRVSARIVLLKGFDERGFTFFTNYESEKAKQLAANPNASLVFMWLELQRQVRIEGRTVKVAETESDNYFASRPRASQIGAWTSPQSRAIPNRQYLEDKYLDIEKFYSGREIPRPDFWGGYRLVPEKIEFWQGREGRLHDRLLYLLSGHGWTIKRLAP